MRAAGGASASRGARCAALGVPQVAFVDLGGVAAQGGGQVLAGLSRRGRGDSRSESAGRGPVRASHLKDPEFAWNLAHSLALDSDHTWSELVKAYEKVDPIATLPIHRRLVENELVEAGAQHYRLAARRLAKMRKLSAGSDKSAEVNDLIADLREIHRRRPRLQQEFDRAGLP